MVRAGRSAIRESAGQPQRAELGAQPQHDAHTSSRHRRAGAAAASPATAGAASPRAGAAGPSGADTGTARRARAAGTSGADTGTARRGPEGRCRRSEDRDQSAAPDARVADEKILVTGLVTDNVEVVRVQVLVNGVEAPSLLDVGVVGRGVPVGVLAELRPGPNVIEIVATDKAGNVTQAARNVTRATGAPAASAAVGPRIANRWAVVIGVGDYESKSVPKLRFTETDADAMYRLLTTHAGYPREHVLLLTDKAPEKPTLQNFRLALGDFLARKTSREDMVLIYYAGHGAPEADAASKESDGLAKYLIPRNVRPESLRNTALPMDEIPGMLSRIPAERVVLLLDTSYGGTSGGRSFAPSSTRPLNLSDQFLERLTKTRGRLVITASRPNEVALEPADLGHGLFTYYLLEGLSGKADKNADGMVTVSELYPYVQDQVERKSRAAGSRQRPVMKGEIEGTLPLSQPGR